MTTETTPNPYSRLGLQDTQVPGVGSSIDRSPEACYHRVLHDGAVARVPSRGLARARYYVLSTKYYLLYPDAGHLHSYVGYRGVWGDRRDRRPAVVQKSRRRYDTQFSTGSEYIAIRIARLLYRFRRDTPKSLKTQEMDTRYVFVHIATNSNICKCSKPYSQ